MSAYVILIREQTTDENELRIYRDKGPAAAAGHSLKRHVAYGPFETLEGPEPEGLVVLEFPTVADAKAWYGSPAYQDALVHRQAGSISRAFIVEGV
jgi:uncharacterized protein (DUF1330 family)